MHDYETIYFGPQINFQIKGWTIESKYIFLTFSWPWSNLRLDIYQKWLFVDQLFKFAT